MYYSLAVAHLQKSLDETILRTERHMSLNFLHSNYNIIKTTFLHIMVQVPWSSWVKSQFLKILLGGRWVRIRTFERVTFEKYLLSKSLYFRLLLDGIVSMLCFSNEKIQLLLFFSAYNCKKHHYSIKNYIFLHNQWCLQWMS